ncbi:MAG: glucosamine-6-phosphate isomerase [Limnochordia bacterium]|jgi:glucosamine-6-phosphate deaminase
MKDEEFMRIPGERLGEGTHIKVETVESETDLHNDMARVMFKAIVAGLEKGRPPVFILPVGPRDQYRRLARLCNLEGVSCRDVVCINMDEYLNSDGTDCISYSHPLSFRRYMDEQFYNLLDEDKRVAEENRIFPHPSCPDDIAARIEALGGVDICFGGVGINGHIAFNEPPDPSLGMTAEEFAALPTRVVELDYRTRVCNAMSAAGGNIVAMPRLAITVGMKEILAARSVHIYLNRSWQAAVVRRMIHGPVTPQVPASLLQNHPDVRCVMIPEVAQPPLAFSE